MDKTTGVLELVFVKPYETTAAKVLELVESDRTTGLFHRC